MVPPDSDRVSPAPPYSGFGYAWIRFRIPGCHGLRPAFPGRSPNQSKSTSPSYNPAAALTATVWAAPRSLAATCGITGVFSSCRYLDVSVPCVSPISMVIPLQGIGLPHSEIGGSTAICASPPLIAACHVLPRLWEPRASPVRPYLTFSSRVIKIVKDFLL